jgi:hypothetical protein
VVGLTLLIGVGLVPSSISKARLRKAFDEGRRSATSEVQNPYDNPKLQKLWEQGRTMQRNGEIKTPIPQLAHGETRAERVKHNAPGTKPAARPAPRPRGGGGFGPRRDGGGGGGGGSGGGSGGGGFRDRRYPRR